MKRILPFLIMFLVLFAGCEKDKEEVVIDNEEEEENPTVSYSTLVVNTWIFDVLNDVYLWRDKMPTGIDKSYEFSPKAYFEKLLFTDKDRWSFIIEDYAELDKLLQNENKSFGFDFMLKYRNEFSNDVVGVVRYVANNSPASEAGLKRGDIFYSINNTVIDDSNYSTLLSSDAYTLGLAMANETGFIENLDSTVSLQAIEFKEDPILTYKVIEQGGKKVGYLMYNSFIYSEEDTTNLQNVFKFFKTENVDDVVLDLRYNGGGSTYIATMIASMLAPGSVSVDDVFYRYIWNASYNEYFLSTGGAQSPNLVQMFVDVPVHLDLNRLYVLTLSGTASASELIINGLRPYMDNVTLIGEQTHGKYTVSIPIDDEQNDYRHKYAMLPIVAKSANKDGVTDFEDGFVVDFDIEDDLLHQLGDPNEALLEKALSEITGIPVVQEAELKSTKALKLGKELMSTKKPLHGIMYTNLPKK